MQQVAVCSSSSPDFKSLTTKPSNQTQQANISLGLYALHFSFSLAVNLYAIQSRANFLHVILLWGLFEDLLLLLIKLFLSF